MKKSLVRMAVVSLSTAGAFAASLPTATLADAARYDICHWAGDRYIVIQVSGSAVSAHLDNHGDSPTGTYYHDADGDGYGDPAGPTDQCPNEGFVANGDDCDDGSAAVNPGADDGCSAACVNPGTIPAGYCGCYGGYMDEFYCADFGSAWAWNGQACSVTYDNITPQELCDLMLAKHHGDASGSDVYNLGVCCSVGP
jgi:hypothetical protein